MSDLDLTYVLASAGPGNLDWFSVDEIEYRALDTLPKQNLDVVPELKAQWSHENHDPVAYFVPNRDLAGYPIDPRVPEAPRTMGDLSQQHGPLSPVLKVARLALMQSKDIQQWQATLTSRFARQEIAAHREALTALLDEKGLLGRLYIAASDFPGCADTSAPEVFVRRHAAQARFVITKEACGDCCHKQRTLSGAGRCGIFHKELVSEVDYTDGLATEIEGERAALGIQASGLADPKGRIKAAYLGQLPLPSATFSGQDNSAALIPASRLLRKVSNSTAEDEAILKARARPIVSAIRRELLKGRALEEIAHGMRLAFDIRDLKASQDHWAPLVKEAGLYGVIYSTQDSFDDCREGADFLSKHGSKVRAIVAGEKCESCIFSKVGRCLMYGRKLVASADAVYTSETVAAVLDEHKLVGSIAAVHIQQDWGSTPREALRNIHQAASTPAATAVDAARLSVQSAFRGLRQEHATGALTRRDILKTASRLMNEGLYGEQFRTAMQAKFDPRDLVAAAKELAPLVARDQGLQGIYFIDPTVYDDYGKGCKEAQRLHRSRHSVRYARVGDKCGSCVYQGQLGVCSVLDKKLAVEPPYQDRLAQQRAILATGNSTELDYGSLVNNGLTMLEEFQLKGAGNLELNPLGESFDASIQFGSNDIELSGL